MFHSPFAYFGIFGTVLVSLVILASSLRYRGKQAERFSPLNHFISELGEVGVSTAASLFNVGFIIGGLFLLPYMVGLGMRFNSLLGWLGAAVGIVASLGVCAVGIFPMNDLTTHGHAAMTYFRAGLIMVFIFALAILFQPVGGRSIPQSANLLSLLAFAAYASFLVLIGRGHFPDPSGAPEAQIEPERPRISRLAILEWAVFFTTILWLFGMAFFM
jgi:hypothetical membrane protein